MKVNQQLLFIRSIVAPYGVIVFLISLFLTLGNHSIMAQLRSSTPTTVTYEELYDDPYEINRLFVHFQPLYGEMFKTNVNAGFGIEAQYYYKDKFDVKAQFRKTYSRRFDHARDVAFKNSDVDGSPRIFNYYEFGGTYYIRDEEMDTESSMILYSKSSDKGNRWASRVPRNIKVPSKVRRVIGARLGALAYSTSTDLNRAMERQGTTIYTGDSTAIPEGVSVFGNLASQAIYLGSSAAWIKNFAIKPDRTYGVLVHDLIFTTYVDLIVAPVVRLDDIRFNGDIYSTSSIRRNFLGLRAGFDGKFNRTFSWAYGAEMGWRPGIRNRGFYTLVKISFPVYSTDLNYQVEAFGK